MQFSQPLGAQQFQGRQLTSAPIQHGLGQSQLNQGNHLNRHLNQFSNPANTALFSAAQVTATSQMVRQILFPMCYLTVFSNYLHGFMYVSQYDIFLLNCHFPIFYHMIVSCYCSSFECVKCILYNLCFYHL